jgi:hypothetical protein
MRLPDGTVVQAWGKFGVVTSPVAPPTGFYSLRFFDGTVVWIEDTKFFRCVVSFLGPIPLFR